MVPEGHYHQLPSFEPEQNNTLSHHHYQNVIHYESHRCVMLFLNPSTWSNLSSNKFCYSGKVTRSAHTAFSATNFLSPVRRCLVPSLRREGALHMGHLFPAFRGTKEGHGVLLCIAVSQVTLVQINHHAKTGIPGGGIGWSPSVVFKLGFRNKREKENFPLYLGKSYIGRQTFKP